MSAVHNEAGKWIKFIDDLQGKFPKLPPPFGPLKL